MPLFGSSEFGVALNGTQIGVFVDHSMAPSDAVLTALRLANEVTRVHGLGYVVDPKVIELWDTLNGEGGVFQSFHGLTGGGYLGTIEYLNTMTGRAVSHSLSVPSAYGGPIK
ncbi:MAG: hypothetical protein DHS20C03_15570 [Minwuia thermotolerans]|nr:MAG: hypothetical protein DHS20C03_15570 [Minwuia thermotolerans]